MIAERDRQRLKEQIKLEGMAEYCKQINACTTDWEQSFVNKQEASRIESELVKRLAVLEKQNEVKALRDKIIAEGQESFAHNWNATSDSEERRLICKTENDRVENELLRRIPTSLRSTLEALTRTTCQRALNFDPL